MIFVFFGPLHHCIVFSTVGGFQPHTGFCSEKVLCPVLLAMLVRAALVLQQALLGEEWWEGGSSCQS